jgi:hypothetical protein
VKALICEFVNLDEIACSETTARSNRFVPANVLYRSSITGALLQACLLMEGHGYFEEFNNFLFSTQATPAMGALKRWYKELIQHLPVI